jgi:hypothetical protein
MWANQREACRPGGTQAILRASMLQGKGCPHLGEVLVACVLMQPVIWYWAAWLRRRTGGTEGSKKTLDEMDEKSVP